MIISSWNIRGLNCPAKAIEVEKYISMNNINGFALLETKVKDTNKLRRKLGRNLVILGIGQILMLSLIEKEYGLFGILQLLHIRLLLRMIK